MRETVLFAGGFSSRTDEIDRQPIQALGFAFEVRDSVLDRCIYDRILMAPARDGWIAAFEKVLIDAAFVVENLERRLQPLGVIVDLVLTRGIRNPLPSPPGRLPRRRS